MDMLGRMSKAMVNRGLISGFSIGGSSHGSVRLHLECGDPRFVNNSEKYNKILKSIKI